jgi:hypothetical protein
MDDMIDRIHRAARDAETAMHRRSLTHIQVGSLDSFRAAIERRAGPLLIDPQNSETRVLGMQVVVQEHPHLPPNGVALWATRLGRWDTRELLAVFSIKDEVPLQAGMMGGAQ